MILPAQQIRLWCKHHELITPFYERVEHCGLTFGLSPAGYDVRIAETVTLRPGCENHSFALASTIERFKMPNALMAIVHDKSTWARRGLATQNTVIEPGWEGYLTLELSNHSDETIHILEGTPIAQVIFHVLYLPTLQPYEGKYQNQESGPQEAR